MAAPKHKHANEFLTAGTFAGLDCFASLEKRISALPTANERGMAFEVFVEAYIPIRTSQK